MSYLLCKSLDNKNFSVFGNVIELPEKPNDKNKNQKWANISIPDFKNGKPVMDILYSAKRSLEVTQLEMHSNSSQTFLPLNSQPFIIVVGINPKKLKALISNGLQGITLKPGTWHCSPLPVNKALIFTLLHRSPDVDLDSQIIKLSTPINLKF